MPHAEKTVDTFVFGGHPFAGRLALRSNVDLVVSWTSRFAFKQAWKTASVVKAASKLSLLVLFSLAFLSFSSTDAEARRVAAAVAMDAATGEVLYARSADVVAYPASLTKMMTLYMAFEAIDQGRLSFGTKLTVSKRASGMPASKLGLRRGSTITVKSALLSLITKSANDAAVVLAETLGGTEIKFAQKMTKKARALGMRKTSFRNASGLTNRGQRSTARDMAKLARALIVDYPHHYHLFSTPKFKWGKRTYSNTNKLLGSTPGVDGLKTGYTRASGFNLAASAKRNGVRIVAVVLGGKSSRARNDRMKWVLDRGFELHPGVQTLAVVKPARKPALDAVLAQIVPAAASVEVVAALPEQNATSNGVATIQANMPTQRPVATGSAEQKLDVPAVPSPSPATQTKTGEVTLVWNGKRAVITNVQSGPFSVQVGAYHDPQRAHSAAINATRKLPAILSGGDIKVSPLKGRKKPIYRARVEGFSKDVADRACMLLRQKNNDCLVVKTASS